MILSSMPLTMWGCPSDLLWKRIWYTLRFPKVQTLNQQDTTADKQQASTNENSQYPQVGFFSSQEPTWDHVIHKPKKIKESKTKEPSEEDENVYLNV